MDKARLIKKYGLEKPFKVRDGKHKYAVFVENPSTKKVKTIKFGAFGYEDFLKHKDEKRRKNFKARHQCSKKKDRLTAGYWSCNYSW